MAVYILTYDSFEELEKDDRYLCEVGIDSVSVSSCNTCMVVEDYSGFMTESVVDKLAASNILKRNLQTYLSEYRMINVSQSRSRKSVKEVIHFVITSLLL